jgi:hypothetical protein
VDRVTGILREELFVEEDEGDLSLSLIATFTEIEVQNRSNRNRKGLLKGLRGEESRAIAQLLKEEDRRVSKPVRGLLLESPGGNRP